MEFLSGACCAVFYIKWGLSVASGLAAVAFFFLLFHALTDLLSGFIYDAAALAQGVCGLAARFASGGVPSAVDGLFGAALGFCVIYAIIVLSRGGMGSGDAVLMAGAGACLGWKLCALGLYLGFMCGGAVVLVMLALKKWKRKDVIPLAPFLAAGCVGALCAGGPLLEFFGSSLSSPW